MKPTHPAIVTLTLASIALTAAPALAQGATVHACVVPQVGAVYLLDLPGLPTECLSEEHQEVRWTDGTVLPGSVNTDLIADRAVTSAKLAPAAVGEEQLVEAAVTASHIAPQAVGSSELRSGSITGVHLAPGAVGATAIADLSVSSRHLRAGSVTTSKISRGAVTGEKIADDAIERRHLTSSSVNRSAIATGAVGPEELDVALARPVARVAVPGQDIVTAEVECSSGREALSGGWSSPSDFTRVLASYPSGDGRWSWTVRNFGQDEVTVFFSALCANLTG